MKALDLRQGDLIYYESNPGTKPKQFERLIVISLTGETLEARRLDGSSITISLANVRVPF